MNQVAISAAIKVLVDGGKDFIAALQPGQSVVERIEDFSNLLGDAMDAAGSISDLPAEIKAIQPSDIQSIAGVIVADCAFTSAKAQAIAAAALPILGSGGKAASELIPEIEAFVAALKS